VSTAFGGKECVMSDPFILPDAARRLGYQTTPLGLQWVPAPRPPVDKERWQTCHCCNRRIPAIMDVVCLPDRTLRKTGTYTYVCPYCNHCHVGTPQTWSADANRQQQCHACGAALNGAYQCPSCALPRGWMPVTCPSCGNKQPVEAPHWVVSCDFFTLECVQCDMSFTSYCIC